MRGTPADPFFRHVRRVFNLGAVGTVSDAQLLDWFVSSRDDSAEAAFEELMIRHGPMVFGICNRVLQDVHDAQDAFQAVFLVLANRARSIRRRDSVASWLFGVAQRVAARARNRAARRRAIDQTAAAQATDCYVLPEQDSDRETVHEELDRLPDRLKAAVGSLLPRRSELRRGGTPARANRGCAARPASPGTKASSEPARPARRYGARRTDRGWCVHPGSSGHSRGSHLLHNPDCERPDIGQWRCTARERRLELDVGEPAQDRGRRTVDHRGNVSYRGHRLGLGAAAGCERCRRGPPWCRPNRDRRRRQIDRVRSTYRVRGVVVDEAGQPVAGINVQVGAYTNRESHGVTEADGSFAIPTRRADVSGTSLLARSRSSDRAGFFRYGWEVTEEQAAAPVRIVLKPTREIEIRVTDWNNSPVAAASVQAAGQFCVYADALLRDDGFAWLRIPADAKIEWIFALKSGRGFDYAEYGPIDDAGRSEGGVPARDLPASVSLTLEFPRTARIKAVDRSGKPVAGVAFAPWLLRKEGRRSELNISTRIKEATTGPDGVATFDWLPAAKDGFTFWPVSGGYFAHRRVQVDLSEAMTATAVLTRTEMIRGHVSYPTADRLLV